MKCNTCGWALDEVHIFNVNCPAANAENDQVIAHVRELQTQPLTPEDEQLMQIALEHVRENMAYLRFCRGVAA